MRKKEVHMKKYNISCKSLLHRYEYFYEQVNVSKIYGPLKTTTIYYFTCTKNSKKKSFIAGHRGYGKDSIECLEYLEKKLKSST